MNHSSFVIRSIHLALIGLLALVLAACGGGGSTPVTGVQLRPLSADFTARKAVAYSPYRTATNTTANATPRSRKTS